MAARLRVAAFEALCYAGGRMAAQSAWRNRLGVGAVGLLLALCGCADLGGELESVRVDSICTLESRLAVLVEVYDPDRLTVDKVTATNQREEPCYLERSLRDRSGREESEAAVYSCWEQGGGDYVVRVTSGKRDWSKRVQVEAGECHIGEAQQLTFELE
jgi:hypothetical protein